MNEITIKFKNTTYSIKNVIGANTIRITSTDNESNLSQCITVEISELQDFTKMIAMFADSNFRY